MEPTSLPTNLYPVITIIALSGWAALIFFPRRPFANFWFAGVIVPLVLALHYMFLLILFWFQPPPGNFKDFFTLAGVANMFKNDGLLLVAWTNLTMMDLVGGAWMARKAAQTRMPYIYLLPCLILTYVFVGFGFALFAVVASFGGRWQYIKEYEGAPPLETDTVSVLVTETQMVR